MRKERSETERGPRAEKQRKGENLGKHLANAPTRGDKSRWSRSKIKVTEGREISSKNKKERKSRIRRDKSGRVEKEKSLFTGGPRVRRAGFTEKGEEVWPRGAKNVVRGV